jgi:hypothetical protein
MIQALSYPGNCVADEPSIERMADRVKCHEKTTSEATDRRDWNAKADTRSLRHVSALLCLVTMRNPGNSIFREEQICIWH